MASKTLDGNEVVASVMGEHANPCLLCFTGRLLH